MNAGAANSVAPVHIVGNKKNLDNYRQTFGNFNIQSNK